MTLKITLKKILHTMTIKTTLKTILTFTLISYLCDQEECVVSSIVHSAHFLQKQMGSFQVNLNNNGKAQGVTFWT